jgi:hypothetical protein
MTTARKVLLSVLLLTLVALIVLSTINAIFLAGGGFIDPDGYAGGGSIDP